MSELDPKSIAIAAAKIRGCTCSPDITITEISPGITTATVSHDHWCRLIRPIIARSN